MNERRKGQHSAVHRLAQCYADIELAINDIEGLNDCERRHRALCFMREVRDVIRHVIDTDLGPKLVEDHHVKAS